MKILFILISIFLLISCKQNAKIVAENKSTYNNTNQAFKDSIQKQSIYYSKINNNSFRIFVPNTNQSSQYFYSDTAISLKVESIPNSKKRNSITLLDLEWTYLTIDSTSIKTKYFQNKPFLLLSARTDYMGRAINEKSVISG